MRDNVKGVSPVLLSNLCLAEVSQQFALLAEESLLYFSLQHGLPREYLHGLMFYSESREIKAAKRAAPISDPVIPWKMKFSSFY